MFETAPEKRGVEAVGRGGVRAFVFQRLLHLREPVDGARIGGIGGDALVRPHRGHERHLVLHGVEDDHDRGAHEERIGHADGIGLLGRQLFDEAHRVVAEITEYARSHRRQVVGNVEPELLQKRPQRRERPSLARLERGSVLQRRLVDLGAVAVGSPENIGIEANDGVTSANGAALHRFEQEGVGAAGAKLEHRRHGRFEVGDEPR